MPIAAVLVASAGMGFGTPFRSNQNTYLLHAVGPSRSQLQDDWLLHTTDPFPIFTAIAQLARGRIGLAIASFLLLVAMFTGLFMIASALLRTAPRTVQRALPPLAVLLLSAASLILHTLIPAHPFSGLGDQYLFSIPSMFQPSNCGALMLLGAAIAVWAITSPLRRLLWIVAAGLAVTTCALHPTYLAPLAVALIGFAVADFATTRTIRRFGWYIGVGIGAVAVVIVTNPVVRDSLTHDGGEPQRYLAFERIPHHTLVSQWSPLDAFLAVVVLAGAGFSVWLTRAWWAATVLTVCLTVALGTALVVEVTRNVSLAMMFPWRITAFLVPVAALTGILWLLRLVAQRLRPARAVLLAVAVCASFACLGVGTYLTVKAPDPASGSEVRAVRAAQPSGVGLIPLETKPGAAVENVRLNAPAAVYVDWKSHPYASADLAEWHRRILAVQLAETDDRLFCSLIQQERIAWVMLRPHRTPPACIVGWRQVDFEGVRIFIG
jgi:hypothetical protein